MLKKFVLCFHINITGAYEFSDLKHFFIISLKENIIFVKLLSSYLSEIIASVTKFQRQGTDPFSFSSTEVQILKFTFMCGYFFKLDKLLFFMISEINSSQ